MTLSSRTHILLFFQHMHPFAHGALFIQTRENASLTVRVCVWVCGNVLMSCQSYSLQPSNAIQVPAWKKDASDRALLDMMPFLEAVARQCPPDMRDVVSSYTYATSRVDTVLLILCLRARANTSELCTGFRVRGEQACRPSRDLLC